MKRSIKRSVYAVYQQLLRRTAFAMYQHQPIQTWPRWVAGACDITLAKSFNVRDTPSPRGRPNFNIIFELLEQTADVQGDISECGVFQGAILIPIAYYVKQTRLPKKVFGLDSFGGFDDHIKTDIMLGGEDHKTKRVGAFNQTSYELVWDKVKFFKLDSYVKLMTGYFDKTLFEVTELNDRSFSFVHLDCDLYESYNVCLKFFYPRMAPGGIILLDEYDDPPWPGCNKAVDEFLADKPELCQPIERDNYIKYYIKKLA